MLETSNRWHHRTGSLGHLAAQRSLMSLSEARLVAGGLWPAQPEVGVGFRVGARLRPAKAEVSATLEKPG